MIFLLISEPKCIFSLAFPALRVAVMPDSRKKSILRILHLSSGIHAKNHSLGLILILFLFLGIDMGKSLRFVTFELFL